MKTNLPIKPIFLEASQLFVDNWLFNSLMSLLLAGFVLPLFNVLGDFFPKSEHFIIICFPFVFVVWKLVLVNAIWMRMDTDVSVGLQAVVKRSVEVSPRVLLTWFYNRLWGLFFLLLLVVPFFFYLPYYLLLFPLSCIEEGKYKAYCLKLHQLIKGNRLKIIGLSLLGLLPALLSVVLSLYCLLVIFASWSASLDPLTLSFQSAAYVAQVFVFFPGLLGLIFFDTLLLCILVKLKTPLASSTQ